MRIAAVGDLHYTAQSWIHIQDQLKRVHDEADVLVLAGDLTEFGTVAEIEGLINGLTHVRVPTIAVLGNHDYESSQEVELMSRMSAAGIKVLDGTSYERAGVGFAGCKGFGGGFGRAALTSLGEPEIKSFVQAAVNESMKLESALSRLRSEKTAVVLHYLPIPDTARGEPLEIYPYLGSSRLGEVIDRRGVDLVIHSHAHFGTPEGRTLKGTPVYNVSLPLLRSSQPPRVYRVLEI